MLKLQLKERDELIAQLHEELVRRRRSTCDCGFVLFVVLIPVLFTIHLPDNVTGDQEVKRDNFTPA